VGTTRRGRVVVVVVVVVVATAIVRPFVSVVVSIVIRRDLVAEP
jgi:hypothetical protein|tara:strand:- start:505 stop:636 length:132 start_codon:yes stop_codon:yes gene_type:complete